MTYTVKEIFYTLQGEGANAGRAAVFLRFSGCNLWTGLERDRVSAVCNFCDTDFVGVGKDGGKFNTCNDLANAIDSNWPESNKNSKLVVCTGGEPLLQLDSDLLSALHARGFEVAVETNGTLIAPDGIDWVCVSPKGKSQLKIDNGHELKLVYPQLDALPGRFEDLDFLNFYLQPMDGDLYNENLLATIDFCLKHPKWRLSLQTHKIIGIR